MAHNKMAERTNGNLNEKESSASRIVPIELDKLEEIALDVDSIHPILNLMSVELLELSEYDSEKAKRFRIDAAECACRILATYLKMILDKLENAMRAGINARG